MKKLNFSCGNNIRSGWDNCDWQKTNRKDVIFCDADKFPYPFKDDIYDYVLLRQCLTLFDNPRKCLVELYRISKNNGTIHIEVAHYSNKGAYTDLDTKHWFNDQTFIKLYENNCRIDKKDMFKLVELKLIPTKVGKFIPDFIRRSLSLHKWFIFPDSHLFKSYKMIIFPQE